MGELVNARLAVVRFTSLLVDLGHQLPRERAQLIGFRASRSVGEFMPQVCQYLQAGGIETVYVICYITAITWSCANVCQGSPITSARNCSGFNVSAISLWLLAQTK